MAQTRIEKTSATCACAHNKDGSTTTLLCPVHSDTDPCERMARVTGKRRTGTIRGGKCTNCGWDEAKPSPEEITTEWTEIRRDGQYFAQVLTANTLAWFHHQAPYSMDHALTHEGYTIHPVEQRIVAYIVRERGGVPEYFEKPTVLAAKRLYNKLMRENEFVECGWTTQRKFAGLWMDK